LINLAKVPNLRKGVAFQNSFISLSCPNASVGHPSWEAGMCDFKKILLSSLFIFIGQPAFSAFQDSTQVHKIAISEIAQGDSTKAEIPQQISKSWFERNPALVALIGALFGAVATLIGVLINHQTKRKVEKFARAEKRAQIEAEREIDNEIKKRAQDDIEYRYLKGLESEHGKISLYGFQSTANVKVGTLEVFVSLRLTQYRRDKMTTLHEDGREESRHLTPEEVLQRAFLKNRLLLIVGNPGSGKTTLLKYYAVRALVESDCVKLGLQKPLIPIILPLSKVDPAQPFCQALSAWATKKNHAVSPELFDEWLEKRGALVMLDGLDEISEVEKRKKVCEWIDNACAAFSKSKFIVTSRYTGYRVSEGIELESDLLRADVLDLNPSQQETFLKKWFTAAYKDDLDPAEPDKRISELSEQAQEVADAVLQFLALEENASLRQLAGTPVLLQIMAILWKEYGTLASGRAALYEKCTDYLLDRRDRVRDILPLLPAEQAKIVLRPIALWMQEKLKTDEISNSALQKRMKSLLDEVKPGLTAENFIKNLIDRAGILQEFGEESYIFRHKSFREFLAAGQLAEEIHRKPARARLLVNHFNDGWWRETLLFALTLPKPSIFADFMSHFLPHKNNAGGFPVLLEQIVKEAPKKSIEPFQKFFANPKQNWQNQHNALNCLRFVPSEPAIALVKKVWESGKIERVRQKAEEMLIEWQVIKPSIIELKASIRGEAKLKSRAYIMIRNPIELNAEYHLIPAGEYIYSVTKKKTTVPQIYLAKYPVTNKLYRRFIDYLSGRSQYEQMSHVPNLPLQVFAEHLLQEISDTSGFKEYLGTDLRSWAKKLRSSFDDDKRFNGDDQPVVGVSWYAAMAYCHWLTELYQAFSAQNAESSDTDALRRKEGLFFRLPTETEWEWAASGGKRIYPWGNEDPIDSRANYGEKIGHTTPVSAYPAGATPEGLMDLAGNVWEWMENLAGNKDYPDARALRGGSWFDDPEYLRCVSRNDNNPDNDWNNNGFRVACLQSCPIFGSSVCSITMPAFYGAPDGARA
jgi:formylglycine-generating enzyme required for sulfatase activity